MKTVQIFNVIVLTISFGLLWLVDQNSSALFQYSEQELAMSLKLNEHTKTVLTEKKKETVDHLLAVMQKLSVTSSSRAKEIHSYASSLKNIRNMILYLIIIQLSITIMIYVKYKHPFKPESEK